MKRCPECQFLYEDESSTCDMDGTPLRYTIKLPTLPGLAQSIWDKWTIALLIGVVGLTVLTILYRATPRAYTSSPAGQIKPVKETPTVSQSPPSAELVTPFESTGTDSATDDSENSADSRDPFAAPGTNETRAQKSKRGLPAVDEKGPAPAIHVQAAENPQTVKASSTTAEPIIQTTKGEAPAAKSSSSSMSTIHPPPPVAATKASPAPQKKESGFKSFLKKAGSALKKPFGEK